MDGIEVVLFDVDNTLYDLRAAQDERVLAAVGGLACVFGGIEDRRVCEAFAVANRRAMGEGYESVVEARRRRSVLFVRALGIGDEHADRFTELYVGSAPRTVCEVSGAIGVVRALAAERRIGVVSNGIVAIQRQKLSELGILELMACVVASEEVGVDKPDPAIFRRALGLVKVDASRCLYVGDDFERDVMGSLGVGMAACWFNPDGIEAPEGWAGRYVEIRELAEVCGVLGGRR